MKFRQKSVTTKKIIVKPRYEEWRLIIGQLGISVLWTWQLLDLGFQFLRHECVVFWILCHQPFVIFFCLASGFWFQPRSWQIFGLGIALSCSSGQSFWRVTFLIDPTRNQNLKFTSLEEATSIPLRGISLKGVCRETKTAHFHQIFQLSTPDRAVGIAHVSLKMGPAFQCIKHFFYNLYIKYKITNVQ